MVTKKNPETQLPDADAITEDLAGVSNLEEGSEESVQDTSDESIDSEELEEEFFEEPVEINIQLVDGCDNSFIPVPSTSAAAGFDLKANVDMSVQIFPGEWQLVPCGFKMALPEGSYAMVVPRSGLALNKGLTILNSPGIIDSDYRGEVGAIIINHGRTMQTINRGDRIAQMVVCALPVIDAVRLVTELDTTDRGENGFGSTGV
jgi:dUTP pyrophosphatase